MTTTTWTFAPAGVLGSGSVDVRPYPGVVVCPTPDAVRGTGLPAVGFAADARAHRRRRRPAPFAERFRRRPGPHPQPATQRYIDQKFAQNDGTTLGIHSPGRPQS